MTTLGTESLVYSFYREKKAKPVHYFVIVSMLLLYNGNHPLLSSAQRINASEATYSFISARDFKR